MAINRNRFYLGPFGSLLTLPPLPKNSNPSASPDLVSGVHQSVSGRVTLDWTAVKRAWNLSWGFLTEDEVNALYAVHYRTSGDLTRLVDGRRTNIATVDASTGGSVSRSAVDFTATVGSLAYAATTPPTDLTGLVVGAVAWTGAGASSRLQCGVDRFALMTGSTYTFSVYAKGSGTFKLSARVFDAAGTALATESNATTFAATGSFVRYSWVGWSPVTSGAVSAIPSITCNTSSSNLTVTGVQVEQDQALSTWVFGAGTPEVVAWIDDLNYPKPHLRSPRLIIREV